MQAIIDKINDNLQVLYRKAVDADKALEQLKGQGKGRHQAIFPETSGFSVKSARFTPYLTELSEQISDLQSHITQGEEEAFKTALPALIKKIELLFITLEQFKGALKE